MKSHYQEGTIYGASNSFFVRYFKDVDGVKKRVSHKLCDRDEDHYSTSCDAVKELAAEYMVTIRKQKPTTNGQRIVDYYEKTYLPTVTKHLKPSTVAGYKHTCPLRQGRLFLCPKRHAPRAKNSTPRGQ